MSNYKQSTNPLDNEAVLKMIRQASTSAVVVPEFLYPGASLYQVSSRFGNNNLDNMNMNNNYSQKMANGGQPGNPLFNMSDKEQMDYFVKLTDYVSNYGVEALSQDKDAAEFFSVFSNKLTSGGEDPILGGNYVQATISAKKITPVDADPIRSFISSPKIQSENFQDFSETKMPEILLEDYEVSYSEPMTSSLDNSDLLSKLGLKLTVSTPEAPKNKMQLKRVKTAKNGGNIYKKFGIKPMGVFYQGGSVDPAFQRNMPVGNSKSITGYIPIESLIPIQTEKDELIVLPTKDVVKVNANKRHSKMEDDEVTDIVPDGSYVLSQYGDVDIYKDEADQYIIETQNRPYNLHKQNTPPTVRTLGDFMTKKKMKPADLARIILSKYKTVDLSDPFAEQTNRANKYAASRYIDAIVELSEIDKERKGLNDVSEAELYQQNPEMMALNGGRVLKAGYKINKKQAGGVAGAAAALLGVGASLYSDIENRKLLKENTAASLRDIDKLSTEQKGYENLSLGTALFNPQDPRVELARQKTGYLSGIRNLGMGTQQLDYLMGRNFANLGASQTNKVYDPQTAAALNAQAYAQAAETGTQAALSFNKLKYDNETNYYTKLGQALQADADARAQENMLTRANVNKNLSDRVAAIMGSMSNRQNQANNEMALRAAARGQQASGLMQLNSQFAQGLQNSMAAGLQAYNSIESARASKQISDAQANYYNSLAQQNQPQPQTSPNRMGQMVLWGAGVPGVKPPF